MKTLVCVLTLLNTGWAMPLFQFSRMDDPDQTRYIGALVEHAKAVSQTDPALHSRVVSFFRLNQPGEQKISGMGQLELNIAYARIADLQAVEKNPKVRRIEVEDVFYLTLAMNKIYLPEHLRQSNFTPWGKTWPPTTMAEAQDSLVRTKAWVFKPVERQPFSMVGVTPYASTDRTLAIVVDVIRQLDVPDRLKEHPEDVSNGCDAECQGRKQEEVDRQNKAFMKALGCQSNGNCLK